MSEEQKDYIDVLEAFKTEILSKKEELEAHAKEAARLESEEWESVMAPAKELFNRLALRYETSSHGSAFSFLVGPVRLSFHVHVSRWDIYLVYRASTETVALHHSGCLGRGQRDAGALFIPKMEVPAADIHKLFPELLDALAAFELKYPEWEPRTKDDRG